MGSRAIRTTCDIVENNIVMESSFGRTQRSGIGKVAKLIMPVEATTPIHADTLSSLRTTAPCTTLNKLDFSSGYHRFHCLDRGCYLKHITLRNKHLSAAMNSRNSMGDIIS